MATRPRDGRSVARAVLQRVRRDQAYANLALGAELNRARLPAAEAGLATELVYGVLRQRGRLDRALARHLRRPPAKTDQEILDLLRLGAYQLLVLDRIPSHAAVNTTVEAARQLRGSKVAGFVNAVLRKLSSDEERAVFDAPFAEGALADGRSSTWADDLSLPGWLSTLLQEELGLAAAQAFSETLLTAAPLVARVNIQRRSSSALQSELEQAGASAERCLHVPNALSLSGLPTPFTSGSYLSGLWTAQDEAAQMVALLLDPKPEHRVLDCCAGIGGKSTHIAELMGATVDADSVSPPLCVDISERKLGLLEEHALRLGLRCATRRMDLTVDDGGLPQGHFHRILLDAPCSGLGVLRRHPELKWRQTPQIDQLVTLQRQLLKACIPLLAPQGVFVYSVCTITAAEGPGQLSWLLDEFPQLELCPPASTNCMAELARDGTIRTWPHEHGTDGFFAARLRRR